MRCTTVRWRHGGANGVRAGPGRPYAKRAQRARKVCGRAKRGGPGPAALEAVAQVESLVEVVEVARLRLAEELGVHAVEGFGVAVVGAFDGGPALGQWHPGHLHSAEAVAGAFGLLEQLHVDLAAEDLVHAAHEPAAGFLVFVEVEVLAA